MDELHRPGFDGEVPVHLLLLISGCVRVEDFGEPPSIVDGWGYTTTDSPSRGRLRVLSGARISAGDGLGSTIFVLEGAGDDDQLGSALDVVGDIDQDGLLDLVFRAGGQPRLLLGAAILDESGADLAALPTIGAGIADAWPTPVGDVTGDGVPDVVVTADNGRQQDLMRVYSGAGLIAGDPDVARFVDGPATSARHPRPTGDVDGDGVNDLLVGRTAHVDNHYDTILFLGPLDGDVDPDAPDLAFQDPNPLGVGDLNGDGHADLGLLWPDGDGDPPDSELALFDGAGLLALGTVSHTDARWVITGHTYVTYLVPAGDLDGDGAAEVWVDLQVDPPHLDVFSGVALEGRTFGAADLSIALGVPQPPAVGDLDGDGVDEIAVVSGDGGVPEVLVFDDPRLDSTVLTAADAAWRFSLDVGATLIPVGDIDGDGADDLALAEPRALPSQ